MARGTVGRSDLIDGAGSIACRAIVARGLDPANGGLPLSISKRTQARL
jgi:hypothetical protein